MGQSRTAKTDKTDPHILRGTAPQSAMFQAFLEAILEESAQNVCEHGVFYCLFY